MTFVQSKTEVRRYVRNSKVRKKKHESSGEIGLNIRTLSSLTVAQDQVFGGVSVPCRHVTPIAHAPWKPIVSSIKLSNATFTEIQQVSMEHLRWAWQASRERFLLRIARSDYFGGLAYTLIVETSYPLSAVIFSDISARLSPDTFSILLTFQRYALHVFCACHSYL